MATAQYDLIVVGEGLAGLTCAQRAAELGLNVATFEAAFFGGLVLNLNELKHFEEGRGLSGVEHTANLAQSNTKAGVKSVNATVTAIRKVGEALEVHSDKGATTARAVVIASGGRLKKLGVAGEEDYDGRGVSHCADCDAPMYTDAKVVVVGGNEWAIHEALVLAKEAAAVCLVHEGAQPQAEADSLERLKSEQKIQIVPNATVEEILGNENSVTGVRVREADGTREIECAGVFPFIGLEPNGEIAPREVPRDEHGALGVNGDLETTMTNLFAIGNVRAGFGGWLRDAVSDARRAAEVIKRRLG